MSLPPFDAAPRRYARLAGVLYLYIIATGGFAEGYVRDRLLVGNDPAASVRNIAASPTLWSVSIALELAIVVFALVQAVIEYRLLEPVDRTIAMLALLMNGVSITLEAVDKVLLLSVSAIVKSDALAAAPREALAGLVLKAHVLCFDVSLLIFGVVCLLLGHLLYHSGYFPKALGIAMRVAGVAYLATCIPALFLPRLANVLLPWVLIPPFFGELSFCLWLLVKGVDEGGWRRRVAGNADHVMAR